MKAIDNERARAIENYYSQQRWKYETRSKNFDWLHDSSKIRPQSNGYQKPLLQDFSVRFQFLKKFRLHNLLRGFYILLRKEGEQKH